MGEGSNILYFAVLNKIPYCASHLTYVVFVSLIRPGISRTDFRMQLFLTSKISWLIYETLEFWNVAILIAYFKMIIIE